MKAEFLKNTLCWDAHTCISLNPQANMGLFEEHLQQGFNFVSVNVGMDMINVDQILTVLASFRYQILEHPKFILVNNIDDVIEAYKSHKLAIAFNLEGALPLISKQSFVAADYHNAHSLLYLFYDLGVRQIHMAYNRNNIFCAGCYDEDTPLTKQGKQLVNSINQVGMMMDCSHTGHRCSLDIMEYSTQPVIFSHANVRHLNPNFRNLTDEQIDACAAQGGVIGINGVEKFLPQNYQYDHADLRKLTQQHAQAMIEEIEYIVNRVGIEHVGIGLDYVYHRELIELDDKVDKDYWWPKRYGYEDGLGDSVYAHPSVLTLIVVRLQSLGYDENDIEKLLAQNFMRIAKSVWKSKH